VAEPEFVGKSDTFMRSCGAGPEFTTTESCTVVLEAGTTETLAGEAMTVNGATGVTVSDNVTECEIEPLVPITVTVLVVAGAMVEAESWKLTS
jgi:hypothetical protein